MGIIVLKSMEFYRTWEQEDKLLVAHFKGCVFLLCKKLEGGCKLWQQKLKQCFIQGKNPGMD